MPDLWKALGDVYGEIDARPVPVEPPAVQRPPQFTTNLPLDDDLAAALSAALVDRPAPQASPAPPAPVAATPPPVAPPAVAPPAVAPVAVAPAPVAGPSAPAPVAAPPVAPVAAAPAPPAGPAPAAAPVVDGDTALDGKAQDRLVAWLADLTARQRIREEAPPVSAIEAVSRAWQRGDDDILPGAGRGRSKNAKRVKEAKATKPGRGKNKTEISV